MRLAIRRRARILMTMNFISLTALLRFFFSDLPSLRGAVHG
ncbi:hypothetical protein GWL_13470 [Herbaspirillum sp. GW103]|jgi:hypothetical protein|nr:hypothetical protein GWL_13470 [Herbaspirillum sp. GW103]